MTHSFFMTFLSNAALLLLIVYVYDLASRRWRWERLKRFGIALGLGIGVIGVAVMTSGISMESGTTFDTRTVLMGLTGLYFGALPTCIAAIVMSAWRFFMGGGGAVTGMLTIWLAGGVGLLWQRRHRDRAERLGAANLFFFGLVLHGAVMVLFLLLLWSSRSLILGIAVPMLLICPAVLALAGTLIEQRVESERRTDALVRSEASLSALYRYAPVALLKEDWSAVIAAMKEIRARGHADMGDYLREHPSEIRRLAGLVRVLDANEAAIALVGAASVEEMLGSIDHFFDDRGLAAFAKQLRAVSQGEVHYQGEANFIHRDGELRDTLVSFFVLPGHEDTYSSVMVSIIDVTEHRRYERQIQESYALLHNLSDHVPGMLFQSIQPPGELPMRYTYVSAGVHDIYGVKPAAVQADPMLIIRAVPPDEREEVKANVMEAARTLSIYHQEHRIVRTDGQMLRVSIVARPSRMADGGTLWHGYIKDVTDLEQIEVRQQIAALMFDSATEAVIITDPTPKIVAVNRAFTRVTGYEESEVVGRNPSMLKSDRQSAAFYRELWIELKRNGSWAGKVWNRRKNGEVYPEWLSLSTVRDSAGRVQNYMAVFSDLSSLHRAQLLAERMAEEDLLTSLPNLGAFSRQLDQRAAELESNRRFSCVLAFDVDRFRNMNDTRGLMFGDNVLKEVATRLRQSLSHEHFVARIGADAFAVLLGYQDETHEAAGRMAIEMCNQLMVRLGDYFQIEESAIKLEFSTGVVVFPDVPDAPAEELIRQLEQALQNSRDHDGAIEFSQEALGQRIRERYQLEEELRRAAAEDQLRLFMQPQVDAAGWQVSAEALIRWQHPQLGLLPPGVFIPLAEASGLIFDLERWVLKAVCRQLAFLERHGHPTRIAMNVSARHFEHDDFVNEVRQQLLEAGANPAGLVLEITESIIISGMERVVAKMNELGALGIHFSLDDFGTGYSSLSYLKSLPIQELKIDRSFIMDAPHDPNDAALVETILGVAKTMQLRVVAEGVETEAQRYFLTSRCGKVVHQGYLYDKPMPQAEWQAKYFGIGA